MSRFALIFTDLRDLVLLGHQPNAVRSMTKCTGKGFNLSKFEAVFDLVKTKEKRQMHANVRNMVTFNEPNWLGLTKSLAKIHENMPYLDGVRMVD
jgi:bifunctional pyridoxal-dependent enzyme with beta-cystathionase and maltose regulon repressor activities